MIEPLCLLVCGRHFRISGLCGLALALCGVCIDYWLLVVIASWAERLVMIISEHQDGDRSNCNHDVTCIRT